MFVAILAQEHPAAAGLSVHVAPRVLGMATGFGSDALLAEAVQKHGEHVLHLILRMAVQGAVRIDSTTGGQFAKVSVVNAEKASRMHAIGQVVPWRV